jgi:single-strand DNA-binding protein
VAASLGKGDRVIVQGNLKSNTYEDKEGNKRTVWELTAEAVGPDLMFAQIEENGIRKITQNTPEKASTPARARK